MSAIYPSSTKPFLILPFLLPVYVLGTAAAGSYQRPNWVFASSTGISSYFCLIMYRSWWLGAKSSWSSISDCEEYGIRVNPKNTIRTRRRPPKLISIPVSPPRFFYLFIKNYWIFWIWYPGGFWKRIRIRMVTGVKWAMVCPPPPLDLPWQQQEERSQRSRPDHRRSHQCRISLFPLTLLRTI